MFDKLRAIESRYEELGHQLAESASGPPGGGRAEYAKLAKARSELEEIVAAFRDYKTVLKQLDEARALLESEEMRDLAADEIHGDARLPGGRSRGGHRVADEGQGSGLR